MSRKHIDVLNLTFGMGYLHNYRKIKSEILEESLKTVPSQFSSYRPEQIESIQTMIEIELVTNAVLYCEDLASIIIALNKEEYNITKTLVSVHETGSGSIKEFYEDVLKGDYDFFWRIMKYDKIEISKGKIQSYKRSCNRFIDDIKKVTAFFLNDFHFSLHQVHKHGLALNVFRDQNTGRDVIIIPNIDNAFDTFFVHPGWYISSFEIIELISNMFTKLFEPLISWDYLEKTTEVDLESESFKVTVDDVLTKEDKKGRPILLHYHLKCRGKYIVGKV